MEVKKEEDYQAPELELLDVRYESALLSNSIEDVPEDWFWEF